MSNLLYPKFKEAALSGNINLPTADIRAIMCDFADYTYSPAHQYLNQVPLASCSTSTPAPNRRRGWSACTTTTRTA
jgi:hypothetical protein